MERMGIWCKSVISQRYLHPTLGKIHIRVLKTAKSFTARWKSADLLALTIPPYVTPEKLEQVLGEMEANLLAKRPGAICYPIGWTFSTPEMTFEVVRGNEANNFVAKFNRERNRLYLCMSPTTDAAGTEGFSRFVKKVFEAYSRKNAASVLIPKAREIARRLGVNPSAIEISYGQKVLGKCFSNGRILLSRNLIYYPEELRELVMAHEFAHLTHLNHSAAFYALLDSYVGGRHAVLNAALEAWKLPF